ncbi:SDR family oxidoreductase [Radiobacillus deserti]|uniref:SDR family oxidoreductase n=1 Tax=Radiobacillus deserti TaxID=2594883 RepID=A0A516KH91_9BACI|nr:SDR family oxidoreductase [Radiobacillus deserti]QDP40762.1 SDR family oxidoreductase [Radiobacillus deserti]
MKYLMTGATGKLGSKIVDILLEKVPAKQLAVSVRQPEKAEHLKAKGIEVRQGDFDYPETLDKAFKGIDRLLIISADGDNETRNRQHKNAVEAAARAGVKFIAYTSIANAKESNMFLAPPHQVAEEAILKTGIPYSFLRNNWYLENELGTIQGVQAGAPWVTSAGEGKVGWALQQDYAEATAAVLVGAEHDNTIYELSGTLYTQDELAQTVGEILGKNIPVQHVDDKTYAETMKQAGLPEAILPMLVEIQKGIRNGELAIESNDFEKILGRPETPLKEALTRLLNQ